LVQPAIAASAPPPVAQALPRPVAPGLPGEPAQRVFGPSPDTLIAPETVDGILKGFRRVYVPSEPPPRIVIYVNRALIEAASTTPPAPRAEPVGETTTPNEKAPAPTLADRQTMREVERLFG